MTGKIIDVNRHDAHDRLVQLQKQSVNISEMISKIIADDPFGGIPFYVFAHSRTADDGSNKRILWQPRLTKPKAQTNSMLFKVNPKEPEVVKVIWMIPDRGMWETYQAGNMFEHQTIIESIHDFEHDRQKLEAKEPDDLSDEVIDRIYSSMARKAKKEVPNKVHAQSLKYL